ncbi:MAG: hypothetical protein WD648_07615 [Planctomycetaceae bacterium]
MEALLRTLGQLIAVLWDLLTIVAGLALPYLPLVAWVVFWLFAVDWVRLWQILRWRSGGWVGLVLIGLLAVLVWGTVSPPEAGTHSFLGLSVSNYVGKTAYVTMLFCIMLLCGSIQLSGLLGDCCRVAEEPESDVHAPHR